MRVNADSKMLADPRFKKLAIRLRITHFEVFGRCLPVWNMAYENRSEFMAPDDIDALAELGGFADGMVAADLAHVDQGGMLRLRGVAERVKWLVEQDRKRELALEARRGKSRGKVPGDTPGDFPGDVPITLALDHAPDRSLDPKPSGLLSPTDPVHKPATSAKEISTRVRLVDSGLAELNAIRARFAAKFARNDVRPLHPMDACTRDLRERLSEAGNAGEDQLRHVLRIAELDALARQSPEYLGGGIFTERAWSKKLAMTERDAMRAIGTKQPEPQRLKPKSRPDDDMPPLPPDPNRGKA